MSNALTVKGKFELGSPSQMVEMAKVLKKHIVSQGLYTPIVGKNYAHVEGWQFAGGLMGLYPRVVLVESLSNGTEIKWKAEVEIVNVKTNDVVSRGFAICSTKEGKKKSFDEYAILSMAQTRAIGKAYRNLIGWVMKLAGYEATPSDEMFKMGETPTQPVQPTSPLKTTGAHREGTGMECSRCAAMISKQEHDYSKKIYNKPLCRNCQKEGRKK